MIEDKNQDIINSKKRESESHRKHRTEHKLCTKAKYNLSKKKEIGICSRRKEIVSRVLIKMHP